MKIKIKYQIRSDRQRFSDAFPNYEGAYLVDFPQEVDLRDRKVRKEVLEELKEPFLDLVYNKTGGKGKYYEEDDIIVFPGPDTDQPNELVLMAMCLC